MAKWHNLCAQFNNGNLHLKLDLKECGRFLKPFDLLVDNLYWLDTYYTNIEPLYSWYEIGNYLYNYNNDRFYILWSSDLEN